MPLQELSFSPKGACAKLFFKDENGNIHEMPLAIRSIELIRDPFFEDYCKVVIDATSNGIITTTKGIKKSTTFSDEEWSDIMEKLKETL